MDWKQYEDEIEWHFRAQYPSAKISRDARVLGKLSRQERQVDILIEDHASDFVIRVAVDAKYRNRRIDVNDVESFLGFLRDIGANVGVMITTEGYSEAAMSRAHHDDVDLQLDILNFKELKDFQSPLAIPHAGRVAHPFALFAKGWDSNHCSSCASVCKASVRARLEPLSARCP